MYETTEEIFNGMCKEIKIAFEPDQAMLLIAFLSSFFNMVYTVSEHVENKTIHPISDLADFKNGVVND